MTNPREDAGVGGNADPGSVDLNQVHRVLVIMILAFAGGVAAFAGVSYFLVSAGTFSPFIGYSSTVRLGIGAFMLVLLGMSYPLSRWSGAGIPGEGRAEAVGRFQTRAMVGAAMRDAVGMMGGLLILLAGDLLLGATAAALSVVALVTGIPSGDALKHAVRGRGD